MEEVSDIVRNLQKLLIHPQLELELFIFQKMLYRNKNQHRKSLYFKQLAKCYRLLRRNWKHRCFENLRNWKNSNLLLSEILTGEEVQQLLTTFESKVLPLIFRAANTLFSVFSQTHFMALSLTMLSILARIWIILSRLVKLLRLLYLYCPPNSDTRTTTRKKGKRKRVVSTLETKPNTKNSLMDRITLTNEEQQSTNQVQDCEIDEIFSVLEK
ncbi:hypothetical protein GpartN1_g3552.t1 [Galdieria partita]|uniref:RNase MRP protein 1 RNA binding domain-containing protein n=1 Tax=Galdieria partita TaxID=83374 RepID=A0A9C7PXN5_9RHOD|nr:hypothetical protein GpartN1_g3552.t1 [Galdieria partita]